MFSSLLGGLGKSLLGGLGSSLLGGGGGGGGLGDGLGSIISSIGKGIAPMIPQLASMGGTALGTMFGGPMGGMVGGSLGSSLGDALGGIMGGSSPSQSKPQQGGQSFGGNLSNMFSNAMGQMPQQFQNSTFGNIGQTAANYIGQQMGHPNFGRIVGDLINPYVNSMVPQDLRNQRMGDFNSYGGNFANQINSGMQRYGMNPYYGGQETQQGFGNIPEAPPFNGGYGNIPAAPPLEQRMQPPGAPGGPRGGFNNPWEEMQGRFQQPGFGLRGQGQPYGNIPEAPPMSPAFAQARPAPSMNVRSNMGARPFANELMQRNGMNNMGLRPTPSRSPYSAPADGNGMMDALRSGLAQRRSFIEPEDNWNPQRTGSM
jgi:hypothetical protein